MNAYKKVILMLLSLFIFISLTFALTFPSAPIHKLPGGELRRVFNNISQSCWAGKYIQGFTLTWALICKNISSFSTLTLSTSQNNHIISGSGLYTKYFKNILNNCWNGRFVRWFDSNKKLICSDKNGIDTLIWTNISLAPLFTLAYPGSVGTAKYNTYLQNLTSNKCWVNESITWFDENGIKLWCQMMIVNWTCGTSNATLRTTAPTMDLCSTWNPTTVIWSGTWIWKCTGINGGTSALCAAWEKTYYSTTVLAASAFWGSKTTNLWAHKHCVISKVHWDLERSTWNLKQSSWLWSIKIDDEWNSTVAHADVTCTDERPGVTWTFLAWWLCVHSWLTWILNASGCCVVGNSWWWDKRRNVHGNFAKKCSL